MSQYYELYLRDRHDDTYFKLETYVIDKGSKDTNNGWTYITLIDEQSIKFNQYTRHTFDDNNEMTMSCHARTKKDKLKLKIDRKWLYLKNVDTISDIHNIDRAPDVITRLRNYTEICA